MTAQEREMVKTLNRRTSWLERCVEKDDARNGRIFDVLELTALQWALRVVHNADEEGSLARLTNGVVRHGA